MDWIKLSDNTPCHGPWQVDAIVTIKTSWEPARVEHGKLLMLSEYKRLKQLNSTGIDKCEYAPYCDFKFKKEQVVFRSSNNLIYPEEYIAAWMPWPDPYIGGPSYRCIDCGALCRRTNSRQKRCKLCQEEHRKFMNNESKKRRKQK